MTEKFVKLFYLKIDFSPWSWLQLKKFKVLVMVIFGHGYTVHFVCKRVIETNNLERDLN